MLGLGTKDEPKAKKADKKKAESNDSGQSDEAKKVLEQMEAKKADGDCAFC